MKTKITRILLGVLACLITLFGLSTIYVMIFPNRKPSFIIYGVMFAVCYFVWQWVAKGRNPFSEEESPDSNE